MLERDLGDLNPERDDFVGQMRRRSFNKGVLAFLRRSIIEKVITPEDEGILHFIWARQFLRWKEMSEEDGSYWGSTIGNTFLSSLHKRPSNADTWTGFKENMLPSAIDGEWADTLKKIKEWDADAVEKMGSKLAEKAGDIWY